MSSDFAPCGHVQCRGLTACIASRTVFGSPAGVATAWAVAHRHVWHYDGSDTGAWLVYHCDDHDPPVVRRVPPWDDHQTGSADAGNQENAVLLHRLDEWTEGDSDTSSLIGWAAAHLRGCIGIKP